MLALYDVAAVAEGQATAPPLHDGRSRRAVFLHRASMLAHRAVPGAAANAAGDGGLAECCAGILDGTLVSLQKMHADLTAKLESDGITTEGIGAIIQFVANVSNGLAIADNGLGERRKIIELFDVTAVLFVEDGKKKIRPRFFKCAG